jgi:tetratricopeptide (TPR) repeat protein
MPATDPLDSHRPPIQLDSPISGCQPHPLPDFAAAITWFETKTDCLLATQQTAAAHGWHRAVWQLAWAPTTYRHRQGHLHDNLAAWRAGLAAASKLGHPATQTLAHGQLGRAYSLVGRQREALDRLHQALSLAENTHDFPNLAYTHHAFAWALTAQGQYRRALEHATHARSLFHILGDSVWEAGALNQMGLCAAQLGQRELGREHCEAALIAHRHHDGHDGVAVTLDNLGYIAHNTGQPAHALDYHQQSLTLHRERDNTYETA